MTQEKMSPSRRRMVEDMQIRGLEATTQASYLRAVEAFAGFLGRSPDSATPEDLRAWQLHMARTQVSIPVFNHRITVLRWSNGSFHGKLLTQSRGQPTYENS